MKHPPWLRFQAYTVGLPKTGSTSMATVFGAFRTAHEWQLWELLAMVAKRRGGQIDDDQFWALATPRLSRPSLEMDATTCHHMYADVLVERYPRAVFVHSIRDVGGWLSSMLDMTMRYRIGRSMVGIENTHGSRAYMALLTEGAFDSMADHTCEHVEAIVPMMKYWAQHMRSMAQVLPADRSLVIRTDQIRTSLPELAALCGVAPGELRADLAHSNQAPYRFDRLTGFATPEVRQAYDEHCADIMARMFPQAHQRTITWAPNERSWSEYLDLTQRWTAEAVEKYGPVGNR